MSSINLVMNPQSDDPPIVACRSVNAGFPLPVPFHNASATAISLIQNIIPPEAQKRMAWYNAEHQRIVLERRDYLNSLKESLADDAQKAFADYIDANPEYFI